MSRGRPCEERLQRRLEALDRLGAIGSDVVAHAERLGAVLGILERIRRRCSGRAASRNGHARRPAHPPPWRRRWRNRCRRRGRARRRGSGSCPRSRAGRARRRRNRPPRPPPPSPIGASRAGPAVLALLPDGERDDLLVGGQLAGERAIGVEHEGGAVEDQLVLAADLVEIDQRQAALGHARGRDVEPLLGLAAPIGRAVRARAASRRRSRQGTRPRRRSRCPRRSECRCGCRGN